MWIWRRTTALLGLAGLVAGQVHTIPEDLQIQTVWENVWGLVQVNFLPDNKVITTHKTGELKVYKSIMSKATDYTTILDINQEVYSWWDHGLLSVALHPQFPEQPYLFAAYSAEYPGKPWEDQCTPDPAKEGMTDPPDTRPYCKSMGRLVRLVVDPDFTKAKLDQILVEDWCTSTYTHHVGTLIFLEDGSLVYGAGDGSHFQGIDFGAPQDECTDPNGPKDQGIFLVQKDQYLRGKFLRFTAEGILKNEKLVKGVDYFQIAKGARNPFRSTVDPKTGDIYFGDVGSAVWEEINRIPNPITSQHMPNFGWPCIEGRDAASEIYQNWLRDNALLQNCADIYRGEFDMPMYTYRFGAVDPDFPEYCADADASVSGLTFYTGDKLPVNYQGKLFFVDYSKKCAFYFNYAADGTVDFTHAHAIIRSEKGLTAGGLTDVKTGPDGYMYIADYSGGMLYRVLAKDDTSLDGAMAANAAQAAPKDDIDVWVETTPGPYEWVYGDEITFKFHSAVDIDPATIKWRVTNLHCVLNACTLEQDCHVHEISLNEASRSGLGGSFHPSPHPMESFIRMTVSFIYNDQAYSKDFYSHARCNNYKIESVPTGLPIIFEEMVCTETPCIVPMMGHINTGFFVQQIQAVDEDIYQFSHWDAKDLTTGAMKQVQEVGYEEVSVADELVIAKYEPVKYTANPALAAPTGLEAVGNHQRVQVKWDAAPEGGPDFIVIVVKSTDPAAGVVKSAVQSSRRESTVIGLPTGANEYAVTVSWYDSQAKARGTKSAPVVFETLAKAPVNSAIPCVYNIFGENMKTKTVDGVDYGLALIGDYPTMAGKGQELKYTIDVQAPEAVDLLVNLLDKNTFDWAGGKTIPLTPETMGVQSVTFTVDVDMEGNQYYTHILLVPPGGDYTKALVETVTDTITGIPR